MNARDKNKPARILKDKFVHGFAWGALLPTIGFLSFYYLNQAMVDKGTLSSGWIGFKDSSIALFAICINLIPTFFANRRLLDNFIRGIMIPTVLASFVWFFYYGRALLD